MLNKSSIILLLILVFGLMGGSLAFADTVYVKGGPIVKGEIVEDADDYVVIFSPDDSWRKVIYKRSIERIDTDKKIDLDTWKKAKKETPRPEHVVADIVYVRGGLIMKGEIVEDADDYVVILDPNEAWRKVIYKRSIERIDTDKKIDLDSWKKAKKETPRPEYAVSDVIYAGDGRILKGEIVEDTDDYITIFDPKTLWNIVIYKKSIERIDSDKKIDLDSWRKAPAEEMEIPPVP